ncbi:MAG: hypothetical protein Fur005_24880 [Roseiflexaceae bacterium]
MAQHEPTISRILQELAREYSTSISERTLFDRVLERRPSQAKDPYASIREKLRWDGTQVGWVRLGNSAVVPLRVVREGLKFRVSPTDNNYHHDQLTRSQLLPFVTPYDNNIRIIDRQGSLVATNSVHAREANFVPASAVVDLGDWFRRSGFLQGDTIIVTIITHEPLTLQLEREPYEAFRTDDVLRQESELLDGIVALVNRRRNDLIPAEDAILPIYARAEWRKHYPGRPWQQLVEHDQRLRLIDNLFIAGSSFRRPLDSFFETDEQRENEDARLMEAISAFQADLLASRRNDAEQGLWDGRAPRASTARVIFDTKERSTNIIFLEPVDTLQDHRQSIDDQLEQGGFDDNEWEDFDDDFDALDAGEMPDFDDMNEIEDLQVFMAENPALAEAAQKLMAALTPDEVDRLQQADSAEEAQHILAARFQKLMHEDPSLFSTLEIYQPSPREPFSNGQSNGGHFEGDPAIDPFMVTGWSAQAEEEEGDWEDFTAEHIPGDSAASREALARSAELAERFHQYLRSQGKSNSTASSRSNDVLLYADFLANYYSRNLSDGDYATLDEFLFFFYPRKVLNSSPRLARELCTSLKQFYAFLRTQNMADDAFAQAIWRRREQAARVIELYEHIDGDSPHFDRLFAHLFAPYTL